MITSRTSSYLLVVVLLHLVLPITSAIAHKFDEHFDHWPVDPKINGRIIVNNGVRDFKDLEPFIGRIAKNKNVVCFIEQNRGTEDNLAKILETQVGDDGQFKIVKFTKFPAGELKEALRDADVVVVQGGNSFIDQFDALQTLKPDFDRFIKKRGTLIVDSLIAPLLGNYFLKQVGASQDKHVATGLDLLPDCVLLCESDDSSQTKGELLSVLAKHPRCVGIGLQTNTTLVLTGRKMSCHGIGKATFMLMANQRMPLRVESVVARRSRHQMAHELMVDLTEWRRDAIDRTIDPFPPAEPEKPFVENGTLVIVGGGGMPGGLMTRIVELAGGKEKAKLVYVPCAEQDSVGLSQRTVEMWKKMGVQHATFIHTKDRNQANSDEEFLAPLKDATGIWFGGGRQWNLADSYYGTKAHRLMKQVLQRGGVIGGSSAGASIQARYLARATPIGNFRIMAPGYERGGLGFISGVAIDQHFSQRRRQADMTRLVNRYPQLLGIGLDEATAIVVQKSKAEVVGRGRVYFYNRNLPVYPDKPDYVALPDGSSYDLTARKVLVDATKAPADGKVEAR